MTDVFAALEAETDELVDTTNRKLPANAQYGGAAYFPRQAVFVKRQRQRMNVNSVCGCLFAPWIMFCLIHAVCSFRVHYNHPVIIKIVIALCSFITLYIGIQAARSTNAKMQKTHNKDDKPEPTWYVFAFITMSIGVVVGTVLGTLNFFSFMQRYYDYGSLNHYYSVDVGTTKGAQVMDAATVEFINSTVLDLGKSMGFKNLRTYCVAPITITNENNVRTEMSTYDFWAVGIDCCSGDSADFHCGEYSNYNAHGGLRLLADEERSFYRLAVQQAEAVYHLRANHPLFFYWTEKPKGEMDAWRNEGYKFFFVGMFVHFIFQCFVVMLGVFGFANFGNF